MDKDEFYNLFADVTTDPVSVERWINEGKTVNWFNMVMPGNTLFSMINNSFVQGLEYYIKGWGEGYIAWTRGKVGGFEHIAVGLTENYYWCFALSEDSSEGQLGKLDKDICENKEELLEGFVNYCNNCGPKYS